MPDQVRPESGRLRLIGLVHHPLARETGIAPALAARLEKTERHALAAVDGVIVTSRGTAVGLADYDVGLQRIDVVEPGTDPAPLARGSRSGVVRLIAVGTLIPRKGYDVLFAALAAMPQRDWHLTCAGSLDRDRATAERLVRQLRDHALTDRVRLAGELDAETLAGVYDESDLFVLPTRHEGYGMAVAEALARGLPVISTDTGAVADLLAGTAGVLVPAGDVPALTNALSQVIGDAGLRDALASGARLVRGRLPTWDDAARHFAEAVERVAIDGTIRR
jgi:glycosyltransferase involved in cell wall biosynthesis